MWARALVHSEERRAIPSPALSPTPRVIPNRSRALLFLGGEPRLHLAVRRMYSPIVLRHLLHGGNKCQPNSSNFPTLSRKVPSAPQPTLSPFTPKPAAPPAA